MLEMRLSRR